MFQAGSKSKLPNVILKKQPKNQTDKAQPKYYKLIFRSRDADSWSNNNANNGSPNYSRFNSVNMPEGLSGNAVLIVDSFVAENLNGELDGGFTVSIKELLQPKTYGTDKDGVTDIVLCGKGGFWQNSSIDVSTCGVPIQNPTFFRNTPITIEFKSIALNNPAFTVGGEWVLICWLIDIGQDGDNDLSTI